MLDNNSLERRKALSDLLARTNNVKKLLAAENYRNTSQLLAFKQRELMLLQGQAVSIQQEVLAQQETGQLNLQYYQVYIDLAQGIEAEIQQTRKQLEQAAENLNEQKQALQHYEAHTRFYREYHDATGEKIREKAMKQQLYEQMDQFLAFKASRRH